MHRESKTDLWRHARQNEEDVSTEYKMIPGESRQNQRRENKMISGKHKSPHSSPFKKYLSALGIRLGISLGIQKMNEWHLHG